MPYAADGRLSRDPIDGGIEITEQQYQQGLAGMLSGEHVQIVGGAFFVGPVPVVEPEPDPEPTPEEIEAQRLALNNGAYETATTALTANYPQLEKDTWPTQDVESTAWLLDPVGASTPWIDRAAAVRGIDREEYLRRTLVKARQFVIMSAWLTGRRQGYEDVIKAGGDPVLDYQLPGEVLLELQAVQQTVMTAPTAQLREALA
ncbi:hypothetical protein H3221_025390 [Pseudomonas sp. LMG 31766]|uniref:Uncharacterized protein n=1 Tax=Pseudomonas chaetocerotis TaxID=2758695 RepID=A0A931D3P6_9PSED|nr:hypothetical protein [Pseudomonas chaetocerotis]MBZ9668074.1 hypothetical protein [Pseudomonas chaetocerotis]